MPKKVFALGRQCAACGANRKLRNLVFDPKTFQPYCDEPHLCNENHPNSTANLISRGDITKLFQADEIEEAYKTHLLNKLDSDETKRIHSLLSSPTTLRILTSDMAEFLVNLQTEKNLGSLAETIRYCINLLMESDLKLHEDYKKIADQKQREENVRQVTEIIEENAKPEAPEEPPVSEWEF